MVTQTFRFERRRPDEPGADVPVCGFDANLCRLFDRLPGASLVRGGMARVISDENAPGWARNTVS
jgi:hypothetical protein